MYKLNFKFFLLLNTYNRYVNIPISFSVTLQKKLESTQEELMRTQIRYQKEIEKLENQNRELRKQLMLRGNMTLKQQRKIKKSLIDMYSEVLDQLSGMYKFRILEFSLCNIMLLCYLDSRLTITQI